MKLYKYLAIAATALSVIASASCKKEEAEPTPEAESVSVNPTELSLNYTGDSQIVKVKSSSDWTASADAEWVKFSPKSGFASETGEDLVISADAATELTSRSCTVTITLPKGATAKVKVTQSGKPDGGISTADEFVALLAGLEGYPADGNYYFKNDIDMAGQSGMTLAEFSGTLDGKGFKILNYVVKEKPLVGTNSGTIKNIIFDSTCSRTEDAVPGISTKTGSALVAQINQGIIENVISNAALSRKADNGFGETTSFGVIASTNEATGIIRNCANKGALTFIHDVTSKGNIYGGVIALGSIAGTNNGIIESCTNDGAFSFDGNGIGKCYNSETTGIGGIAGINNASGSITGCTNNAAIDFKMLISSQTLFVGGIAGQNNQGTVGTSSCNGNITVDGISEDSSKLPGGTADVNAGLVCGNSTESSGTGTVTVKNIGVPDPELHISSAEDFANFISTAASYPANATIYLDADIDISAATVGSCSDTLRATFDGQGHHINGINESRKEKCFFKYNAGTIKNVILGKDGDQANIVLGNFSTGESCPILTRCNLGTVEGCVNYVSYGRSEDKNFGAATSIFGFLVGTNSGTVKNCTNYGTLQIITTAGKALIITKTSKECKNYFGTIVGNNDEGASVSGCVNNGSITLPSGEGAPIKDNGDATKAGYLYIGAICGRNAGTVDSCTNNGSIDINAGVTGTLENVVRFGCIYGGGNGVANNCTVKGSLTIQAYSDSNQNYKYGAVSGADALGSGNVYGECILSCTDNNGKGMRNPNEQ